MAEPEAVTSQSDGRHDFDFFVGNWRVHNRRLSASLAGSDTWEEFEGSSVARSVLDGLGNVDEITLHRASGTMQGMTLRLFDPETRLWSLYWADSKSGILQAPMVGAFRGGRGAFYAHERFGDKQIFTRFLWSIRSGTSCRWEQAFSIDGGASWETNWVMEFEKTS